jgi:hypothetical protein
MRTLFWVDTARGIVVYLFAGKIGAPVDNKGPYQRAIALFKAGSRALLTGLPGSFLTKDEPSSAKAGEGFILANPSIAGRCRLNGLPHTGDAGLRGVALRLGGAHRFADNRTCQDVSVTLPIGFGGVRSLGGLRRAAHDNG